LGIVRAADGRTMSTILLVEDDPDIRHLVSCGLTSHRELLEHVESVLAKVTH
jgi:CheY-like chemotaxis protein